MPSSALPAAARRRWTRVCAAAAGVGLAGTGLASALASPAAAATTSLGQSAVQLASAEAGKPYVYGSAGPSSFDCSGLVQYVYRELGISLPRTTTEQYAAMAHVPASQAVPGDVLFFYDSAGTITHDAIYAGGNQMWVAPRTGDVVRNETIYTSAYWVGDPTRAATSASAAPVSDVTAASTPVLREGSRGPAVTVLQRRLGISADGDFGPVTAASVGAFQRSHRLVADEVVGPLTWAALRGAASPAVPAVDLASGAPLLREGATGSAVATLQRDLRISADGVFGPVTRGAVLAFQRSHQLAVDGIVGPATWGALHASAA